MSTTPPLHTIGRAAADVLATLGLRSDEHTRIAPSGGLPAWSSALHVAELAMDSVALSSLCLTLAGEAREGRATSHRIRVDPSRVAASFGSDRLFAIDGRRPDVWSPLSGFWRSSDGWIRTHANYPHHAERLRALLGIESDARSEDVARAIAQRTSEEWEARAARSGAVVVAVRDVRQWHAHPQERALRATRLLEIDDAAGAPPRAWRGQGPLPLSGIRVLDLTRVIAGPVATRALAFAGADVLRIDPPTLPEPAWQFLDTGQGKRSALRDLRRPGDRAEVTRLLRSADVLVLGYRPGALARFGLDGDTVRADHPGLVVAELSAWGWSGPWAGRRGFDSIVQAATGIALAESGADDGTPGALPVQALDHGTGYLLAAAIAIALRHQHEHGGSARIRASLARLAGELLMSGPASPSDQDRDPAAPPTALPVQTQTLRSPGAAVSETVRCAPAALDLDGVPALYPPSTRGWGADSARWLSEG